MLDLKKYKKEILFLPLGGSGEIGMNCNLYHYDGKWLIMDCGIGFANGIPGVDIIVPDIAFIKKNIKDFVGIVITHIHEDHIGAIQYLWEELRLPVYLSTFAKLFLTEKLKEYKFCREVEMRVIHENKPLKLKPFELEFVGITHSTPDMLAAIIKTPKGNILHTGDWKFDKNPPIGEKTNMKRLRKMGKDGEILAMTCDSTNIFTPGYSKSENDIIKPMHNLFKKVKGMIVCTTFSSNVSRLHTIISNANRCGRKVIVLGRSIDKIIGVSKRAGFLSDQLDIIDQKEIKKHPKSKILVLAAGSQGEDRAATSKIARGMFPDINLNKDDAIIFSSKIIPGNERKIFDVYNIFAKNDVQVITEKQAMVHVSGHYTHDDLVDMYSAVKPSITIPVHGEAMHLAEHKRVAKKCGIKHIIKGENGVISLLSKEKTKEIARVPFVEQAIDGKRLLPVNSSILQERRTMQDCGVIFVNAIINNQLKLLKKPVIEAPGVYNFHSDPAILDIMIEEIEKNIEKARLVIAENKSNKFESEEQKYNYISDTIKKSAQFVVNSDFGKKAFVKAIVTVV